MRPRAFRRSQEHRERLGDIYASHPLGSVKTVAAIGHYGAFMGLVDVAGVHAAHDPDGTVLDYITHRDAAVGGKTAINRLLLEFESRETEILVVTDDKHRVRGYITEAHAPRRYREELDKRQKEIFGNDA
jgi:chloride channel protein, CIC family